jgi:hypothetical protein
VDVDGDVDMDVDVDGDVDVEGAVPSLSLSFTGKMCLFNGGL